MSTSHSGRSIISWLLTVGWAGMRGGGIVARCLIFIHLLCLPEIVAHEDR